MERACVVPVVGCVGDDVLVGDGSWVCCGGVLGLAAEIVGAGCSVMVCWRRSFIRVWLHRDV